MTRWALLSCFLGSASLFAIGCDEPEPVMHSLVKTVQTAPASDPSRATIHGRIVLADGATLPVAENPLIGLPGQPPLPEACTVPLLSDRQIVTRAAGGGLTGLVVALHDFSSSPRHEPTIHELEIANCRLSQPVVTATIGDTLRITNHTDYPFLPSFGSGTMHALFHDASRDVVLAQAGNLSLTCGFAAPCGRTEVVTLYHPLHTITDPRGEFVIEGVPSGEEVRLGVWHPLFEEAGTSFTLQPGETREIEVAVTPRPPPPPPAPVAAGHPEDDPSILF